MSAEQLAKIWLSLWLAGHKSLTIEEVRAAISYSEGELDMPPMTS